MKLTANVKYAIQIVRHCAARKEEIVSRKELCDVENIPAHFCAKIAQDLAKCRIISILQGSRGGFQYIGDDDISYLSIVEAMIGPLDIAGRSDDHVSTQFNGLNQLAKEYLASIKVSEDVKKMSTDV